MAPNFENIINISYISSSLNFDSFDFIYNPFDGNGFNSFYYYSNNNDKRYHVYALDYWLHLWLQRRDYFVIRCIWHDQLTWYWLNMNQLNNPAFLFADYLHTPETAIYNFFWGRDEEITFRPAEDYRIYCWENMYFWYIYSKVPSDITYLFRNICQYLEWDYAKLVYVLPLDIHWLNDSNYYIYPNLDLYCSNNIFVILYDRLLNILVLFNIIGSNHLLFFKFGGIFKCFYFINLKLKKFIGFFIFIHLSQLIYYVLSCVWRCFYSVWRFFYLIFHIRQTYHDIKKYLNTSVLYWFFTNSPILNHKWRTLTVYYKWQVLLSKEVKVTAKQFLRLQLIFLGYHYSFLTFTMCMIIFCRSIYIFLIGGFIAVINFISYRFHRYFDYYLIYHLWFYFKFFVYYSIITSFRYVDSMILYPVWRLMIMYLNNSIVFLFNESFYAFIRAVFFFYHKVPFYLDKNTFEDSIMIEHSNFFYFICTKVVRFLDFDYYQANKLSYKSNEKVILNIFLIIILNIFYSLFSFISYIFNKSDSQRSIVFVDFVHYFKKKILQIFILRKFSIFIFLFSIFYFFIFKIFFLLLISMFLCFYFFYNITLILVNLKWVFLDYFLFFFGAILFYFFCFVSFFLKNLFIIFFVLLFRFKFLWFLLLLLFWFDINFLWSFIYHTCWNFPMHFVYSFYLQISDIVLRFACFWSYNELMHKFLWIDSIDAIDKVLFNYARYVDRYEYRYNFFFYRLDYQDYYSPTHFDTTVFKCSLLNLIKRFLMLKQMPYYYFIKIIYFYWAKFWITPWAFIMNQPFYLLWWPIYCFIKTFLNLLDNHSLVNIYLNYVWFYLVPFYFTKYFITSYYFLNSWCFFFKYDLFISYYCYYLDIKFLFISSNFIFSWPDFVYLVKLYWTIFLIICRTIFFDFWTLLKFICLDLFSESPIVLNYFLSQDLHFKPYTNYNGFYYLKSIHLIFFEWSDKFFSYFRISPITIQKYCNDFSNHRYLEPFRKFRHRTTFFPYASYKKENVFNLLLGHRSWNFLVLLRKEWFVFTRFDPWEIYMLTLVHKNLSDLLYIVWAVEMVCLVFLYSFIFNAYNLLLGDTRCYTNSKFLWSAFQYNNINDNFDWLRDDFSLSILEKYSSAFIEEEISMPQSFIYKKRKNIILAEFELSEEEYNQRQIDDYIEFIRSEKQALSESLITNKTQYSFFKKRKNRHRSKKNIKRDINKFRSIFKKLLRYEKKRCGGSVDENFLKDFESSLSFDYTKFYYSKDYSNFCDVFGQESSKLDIFIAYGFRHNIYLNNLYEQLMLTHKSNLDIKTWFYIERQFTDSLYNFFLDIDKFFLSLKGVNWLWHKDRGTSFVSQVETDLFGRDLFYLESDPIIYSRGFIWTFCIPWFLFVGYYHAQGFHMTLAVQDVTTGIFLKMLASQVKFLYDFYIDLWLPLWSFAGHDTNGSQVEFHRLIMLFGYKDEYIHILDPLGSYHLNFKEHYKYEISFLTHYCFLNYKGDFNILILDYIRYIIFIVLNLIWFRVKKKNYNFVYFNKIYKSERLFRGIGDFYDITKVKLYRHFKKNKIFK